MAGWHVVEKYLEETGKHSTLIGKYWITMFLVLRKFYELLPNFIKFYKIHDFPKKFIPPKRLLILFSICEAAFGDVGLECDTKTPGCE